MHSLTGQQFQPFPSIHALPSQRQLPVAAFCSIELFFVPRPPLVHFHFQTTWWFRFFLHFPVCLLRLDHFCNLPTTSLDCITHHPGFPQIHISPNPPLHRHPLNTTSQINHRQWRLLLWTTRTPTAIASMVCPRPRPYCVIVFLTLPCPALCVSTRTCASTRRAADECRLYGVLFATSASACPHSACPPHHSHQHTCHTLGHHPVHVYRQLVYLNFASATDRSI